MPAKKLSKNKSKIEECIICLSKFKKGEFKVKASHGKFNHSGYYHENCIKKYFKLFDIPKCPLCRNDCILDMPNYKKINIPKYSLTILNESNEWFQNLRIYIQGNNSEFRGFLLLKTTEAFLVIQRIFREPKLTFLGIYLYSLFIGSLYSLSFIHHEEGHGIRRRTRVVLNIINIFLYYFLVFDMACFTCFYIEDNVLKYMNGYKDFQSYEKMDITEMI